MADVIPFPSTEHYLSGKARCLQCQYEWVGVAPVGTVWLECPSCHTHHGTYIAQVEREEEHWQCDCGNPLFYVTKSGIYCPMCGCWQQGF